MLHGVALILPGGAMLWRLFAKPAGEVSNPPPPIVWGSSLYFHLVAIIALMFVLVGVSIVLHSLADLVSRECFQQGPVVIPEPGAEPCSPRDPIAFRAVGTRSAASSTGLARWVPVW